MSRVRFATARSLFETFPELAAKSQLAPTEDSPVLFLETLLARERFDEAVAFCAHLLPRREAVWWACGTARSFLGDTVTGRSAPLQAAETWVVESNDKNRSSALEIGTRSDQDDPLTWLALGAGWAGGMLSSHPQQPVPMPQYMSARAARIAILLSARNLRPEERRERMRR